MYTGIMKLVYFLCVIVGLGFFGQLVSSGLPLWAAIILGFVAWCLLTLAMRRYFQNPDDAKKATHRLISIAAVVAVIAVIVKAFDKRKKF